MYCMEFEPLYEHIYIITVAWAIWMTLWGIGVFCLLGLYKAMQIGPFYTFGMHYRTYFASMLSMMYHCLHTRTFQKTPVIVTVTTQGNNPLYYIKNNVNESCCGHRVNLTQYILDTLQWYPMFLIYSPTNPNVKLNILSKTLKVNNAPHPKDEQSRNSYWNRW